MKAQSLKAFPKDSILSKLDTLIRPGVKQIKSEVKRQATDAYINSLHQLSSPSILKSLQPNIIENLAGIKGAGLEIKKSLSGKPLEIGKSSFVTEGFYWPSDTSNWKSSNGLFSIQQELSLFTIPVDINIMYNDLFFDQRKAIHNYSFDYNQPEFLSKLGKQLGKLDPKDFIPVDASKILREQVTNIVEGQVSSWKQQYGQKWDMLIQRIGDPQLLLKSDISSLRSKVFPDSLFGQLNEWQSLYEYYATKGSSLSPSDTLGFRLVKEKLEQYEGLKEIWSNLEAQKEKWQKSGLVEAIRKTELLQLTQVRQMLQSPETIKKLAREKLNLNGLQKLFLNITRLNIGQTSLTQGMGLNQYLSKGIFTEFLSQKNNYLSFLQGKHQDFPSVYDLPFSGFMQSNANTTTGIRLGKGALQGNYTHISLLHYRMQNQLNNMLPGLGSLDQKATVIGISKALSIGARGRISGEFSKSVSEFNFAKSPLDSFRQNQSLVKSLLQGENFFNNFAFDLDYTNNYEKIKLDQRSYVRYAGTGYNNPGNFFMPAGSVEIGNYFRKSAYKGKLLASIRFTTRQYHFSENSDIKYRNLSLMADLRWKFRKGQFMSIRYQPSSFARKEDGTRQLMSKVSRLSLEGQLNQRIAGLQYRNFMSFTWQDNFYVQQNGSFQNASYSGLLLNMFQQVLIRNKTVFINLTHNATRNQTQYIYFNSSTNIDAGSAFSIGKAMQVSSSLTYNAVKGWYAQVGLRQSVSASYKSFQFNINADIRTNLKVQNPLYQELLRIDWGMRYIINRK